MFESLHELVKTASVDRISISMESQSKSRITVTIQSILGAAPKDASDEQVKLRHALSMPICIEGNAGEIDANVEGLLDDYIATVRPKADVLKTNAHKVAGAAATADAIASEGESIESTNDLKNETNDAPAKQAEPEFTSEEIDCL